MQTKCELNIGRDYWYSPDPSLRVYDASSVEVARQLQQRIKKLVMKGTKVRVLSRSPSVLGVSCTTWYVHVKLPPGYIFS